MTEDPRRTVELLNDGAVLFISSDGSVLNQTFGSFGYTITHVTSRTRLAKGRGPVFGDSPSSFRAEAYGALAVGRLLFRLSEYTGQAINQCICHWIDNQGVVQRILEEFQSKYKRPNLTLQPDWDIIHEVATTYRKLSSITYTPKWIRSHQDATTPYQDLTLEAQMNCDADKQAEEFHQSPQGRQRRPRVPLLPHTHAHLVVQGRHVTSSYKTTIRDAATLPSYFQYLQQRFEWEDGTIQKIDWDMVSQLVMPFDDARPTLVKHMHGIAPTGIIANRNDPQASNQCPACLECQETNDHLFVCPAPSRDQWRQTLMTGFRNKCKTTLPGGSSITTILIDGVTRSLHLRNANVNHHDYPPEYHQLIHDQNDIGWLQLFRCRWAKEWTSCYIAVAQQQGIPKPTMEARKWVQNSGKFLLQQWWALWKLRTEERHGHDQETKAAKLRDVVMSQLEALYRYRLTIMPVDRRIYPYENAHQHLNCADSLETKLEWCLEVSTAIQASHTQATQRGIQANQNIQNYMSQRGQPPPLAQPEQAPIAPPRATGN